MPSPDRPLFTRRTLLKIALTGVSGWALSKLFWPISLTSGDEATGNNDLSPAAADIINSPADTDEHEPVFRGAIAAGRIALTDKPIPINIYPDNSISLVGPFNTEPGLWPIYPGARIVVRNGENQLLVPISKTDAQGAYAEVDIRYFRSIDGDPIGEVPASNNSWIGIGGNWPVEAFSTVENLGVGFLRVNRSNPLFKETLAKARVRGIKTIFTYDLNFAERMSTPNGVNQLKTLMDWELREVAQNYQPAMVEIANEPDFNKITPEMYTQIFSFATDAFTQTSFSPKLLAASIRPDHLEDYLKELLKLNLIPWAHDIHAYQKPNAIGDVYNQTLTVLNKYPQFHRDHLIVLEWGISGSGKNHGNKNQIINGLNTALSLNLPVAVHQFFNADGEDYGLYNPTGYGGMKPSLEAYLFKQFIKQTPRPPQPADWW